MLCNVRTPQMNAIAERWIGGCRRELLDRTLIWNQTHLRQILRKYETHHNVIAGTAIIYSWDARAARLRSCPGTDPAAGSCPYQAVIWPV